MAETAIPVRPMDSEGEPDSGAAPPPWPREKVLRAGPRALSSTELLALIIGSGTRREGVIRLSRKLVRRHGLERMPGLTLAQWRQVPGVGLALASRFVAVFELARRLRQAEEADPPRVCRPEEASTQVPELRRARKEHLVALYLDAQNRLLAKETITIGSLNTTRTHPREILYPAIQHLALGFVLVHNHPSGSLTPSVDDVDFTRAVRRAGELVGIELYDHLIVSPRGFVSLKEKGLL
jgi:DNA repair protein RadC